MKMTDNLQPLEKDTQATPVPSRQWRVGTISMGLTLIVVGILLFLGEMDIHFIKRFWPLILVILGTEMVLMNFLINLRGGKVRLTYDGLSIFMVILMLLVSGGLVVLETTGLIDLADRAIHTSHRYYEAEKVLYPVDSSVTAICLSVADGTTTLRPYEGNEVSIAIVYSGYFASDEEAQEYARGQVILANQSGGRQYIEVYEPTRKSLPRTHVSQELTILIPRNLTLEYEQTRGRLKVMVAGLAGNWLIDHDDASEMEVKLATGEDCRIDVDIASNGRLRGNFEWDEKTEDGSTHGLRAQKTLGAGNYTLLLRKSSGSIKIDTQ